jgi:hypothetical protein
MTSTEVFLFPRNPKYVKSLKKELDIYKEFSKLEQYIPIPKLIKKMHDKEISYYEF